MSTLISLRKESLPGFISIKPTKRLLLSNHIALLVDTLAQAKALLPDFCQRVRGLIITVGEEISCEDIGPDLWHMTFTTEISPHLQHFARCSLEIMVKRNADRENDAIKLAEMAYNDHFLMVARQGYSKAMARLQEMIEEVKDENHQRQKAIKQLNHEIEQRKQAQKEQLRLEGRLAQAQKMEAIGLMAGGVAHDLNNVLAGIVGYPDLLLLTLPEDHELRPPLTKIKESGLRAAEVVSDLLAIARSSARPHEPADPNAMIGDYLNSLEFRRLRQHYNMVDFVQELTENVDPIFCSPSHFKKCLMNLVINGAEAINNQGKIIISSRNISIDQRRDGLSIGDYVAIAVKDSGQGISAEHLPHIFEPFYSRKKLGRSGTGLGLAVVWNTVHDHGGEIKVKSSKQGSSFTLYFPTTQKALPKTEAAINVNQLHGNMETILVVDDEQLLREVAGKILTELDYQVETVSSGEEAVNYLRTHKVDLLLLDMLMEPGINGRQTYEEILRFRPKQKAIIASGYAQNADTKAMFGLGALAFVRKPYTIVNLGQAVFEALQA